MNKPQRAQRPERPVIADVYVNSEVNGAVYYGALPEKGTLEVSMQRRHGGPGDGEINITVKHQRYSPGEMDLGYLELPPHLLRPFAQLLAHLIDVGESTKIVRRSARSVVDSQAEEHLIGLGGTAGGTARRRIRPAARKSKRANAKR